MSSAERVAQCTALIQPANDNIEKMMALYQNIYSSAREENGNMWDRIRNFWETRLFPHYDQIKILNSTQDPQIMREIDANTLVLIADLREMEAEFSQNETA